MCNNFRVRSRVEEKANRFVNWLNIRLFAYVSRIIVLKRGSVLARRCDGFDIVDQTLNALLHGLLRGDLCLRRGGGWGWVL